jgi:hypothetical protein
MEMLFKSLFKKNWEKEFIDHIQEFERIQNNRGYILKSRAGDELVESFFVRLGDRLHEMEFISEREREEMKRVVYVKKPPVPELQEKARQVYIKACTEIRRPRPSETSYDVARSISRVSNRWWDALIP